MELWSLLATFVFLVVAWIIPDFQKYQSFFISPTPTIIPKVVSQEIIVTRVIDGDTIELSNGKQVRYIGIDTPERDECFFQEAKLANEKMVLNKKVRLVKDVSQTDKYGRLLRYVYVNDIFVNEYLLKQGYALVATYPPDVAYTDSFVNAQQEAQNNKRGFWSEQSGCGSKSADSLCLNYLGEPHDSPACAQIPSEARSCQKDLDCYATCSLGCLSRVWKVTLPIADCLAEPAYTCFCVNNICQKRP